MQTKWKLTNAEKGAQIRVNMGGYYHYGIFLGSDEVIEFGAADNVTRPSDNITVDKVSVADFSGGRFVEVRQYSKSELKLKRSDEDIVNYALSKLGQGGYDIIHYNCEHFANECVFGRKDSEQVSSVRNKIREMLNK
ncbi:MAG: lecithin retinol acyltransferase family protein [Clostridia bacterium]|nr:lecithin retinol acyltransferase family protein [Clostridia bacterium]